MSSSDHLCPECSAPLVFKFGRYWARCTHSVAIKLSDKLTGAMGPEVVIGIDYANGPDISVTTFADQQGNVIDQQVFTDEMRLVLRAIAARTSPDSKPGWVHLTDDAYRTMKHMLPSHQVIRGDPALHRSDPSLLTVFLPYVEEKETAEEST